MGTFDKKLMQWSEQTYLIDFSFATIHAVLQFSEDNRFLILIPSNINDDFLTSPDTSFSLEL